MTLALVAQFEVADHIGCVAAANGVIWGGNWDSTHLYRWRRDGTQIDKGAIDWIDPATLEVTRRIVTGVTDRGVPYTNEGMTIRGSSLYLLPEDDRSRLFRYQLP